MRLWGGRFGEENDARVADFTRSIEIDAELALADLRGSVAHVRGLGRAGILTDEEVAMLIEGLEGLTRDVEAGTVVWDPTNTNQALPDSLYLSSKPAFFGTNRWPWVDPVGTTKLYTLPAKARWDSGNPNP